MCLDDVCNYHCSKIERKMLPRGYHIRVQFLSTIFANLLSIAFGLSLGWSIIYEKHFDTVQNPLQVPPLTSIEIKWISLSLYFGGLVGTVFLTMMGDVFGRKYTLVVLIIPQGFAWLIKMVASNATELYIGSILEGFSAGGSINLIVLFVAELADDKFRGRLGSIMPLFINIGLLTILICNYFLSFYEISSIAFVVLFIYLCIFTFFPDTPRQLYKIRRKEEAIKSLQVYRDIRDLETQTDDCYNIEVKNIRRYLISSRGLITQNSGKAIGKSIVMSVALIVLNVYVSWFILLQLKRYELLDTSLLSFDIFRIVIAICQVAGSLLCLILVDFIERKSLLLASIAGVIISQIMYIAFELNSETTTSLPILFIAVAAFSLHFGIFPLSFIIIPEIVPEKVRIYSVTLIYSIMWLLMILLSSAEGTFYSILEDSSIAVLSISITYNLIFGLMFYVFLPSTRKKSYGEIFSNLNFGLEL